MNYLVLVKRLSRTVTGRKLTALPYNLINILVPESIISLLYSGILLKQNLIMMSAAGRGVESINLYFIVYINAFLNKLYFFFLKFRYI